MPNECVNELLVLLFDTKQLLLTSSELFLNNLQLLVGLRELLLAELSILFKGFSRFDHLLHLLLHFGHLLVVGIELLTCILQSNEQVRCTVYSILQHTGHEPVEAA